MSPDDDISPGADVVQTTVVSNLGGTRRREPSPRLAVVRGDRVDHFSIERRLGSGGMGTVYEAWDEQLQRRVALKFLRNLDSGQLAEQRLFREAQGLAQLSHPNVVPVYDLGRHEGRVWIAMEYVPGQTLGEWVRRSSPRRAEILRHWIAAGHGLAAIHAVGLIHRDIKPDNVLLGDDGRVRIIDFGLVKVIDSEELERSSPLLTSNASGTASLVENVTSQGSFLGTPAYASPEHWEQQHTDTLSDQYSFCAALWEALCGLRPDRCARDRRGMVPLPDGQRMSKRLHRALSRGLSLDPAARFPDMNSLLAALEPPARRWIPPLALVLVGVVALSLTLHQDDASPAAVDPCAQAAAPIESSWTAARRELFAAQLDPELALGAQRVTEDWVDAWSTAAYHSCEAFHVQHRRSAHSLDRQTLCLDRALQGFEAYMRALEAHGVDSPTALGTWLSGLDNPRDCLGEIAMRVEYELPAEDLREEIEALERKLSALRASAAPIDARIEVAKEILAQAQDLGWRPLIAESSLALGKLHAKARDSDAARDHLGRALDIAQAGGDLELAADAWSDIGHIARLADHDLILAKWATDRERALFDDVEPTPRRRAILLFDRAAIAEAAGDIAQAETKLREAVAIYEALGPGTTTWKHAEAVRSLSGVLSKRGRDDEAVALLERARDLELRLGGAAEASLDTVSEAEKLLSEGVTLTQAGELQKGIAKLEQGLELASTERGPRSELVARLHMALASAYDNAGDPEAFRLHTELADTISLAAVGPHHILRCDILSAVGALAMQEGRYAASREAFADAYEVALRHTTPDSMTAVLAERNLAVALHALGEDDHARQLFAHVIPRLEELFGDQSIELFFPLEAMGEIHLKRGESDKAQASLLRARALLEKDYPDSELINEIDGLLEAKE
ncbi:protein kinase [Pseudenhygromyxa sp. WMMC2535]|uniref:protein kinase domain-containing protein n=1 Tax=Pseudenhygromyxa sp. WMMC2535 TaxID=2712867 RepID=UPI001552772B|nr:protein kinase [Pseudenhygromyxa sp. WMMC2535]